MVIDYKFLLFFSEAERRELSIFIQLIFQEKLQKIKLLSIETPVHRQATKSWIKHSTFPCS